MKNIDFNKITNRRNTSSLKYDFAKERGKPEGLLSLWVADMDFPAPAEVLSALERSVRHGIFGYTEPKDDYYAAVTRWFSERFGFETTRRDIVKTPGVVFALAQCVRAYTREGDAVLIQPPVYYPFFEVVRDNNRRRPVGQGVRENFPGMYQRLVDKSHRDNPGSNHFMRSIKR
jgi:cystathionine beta-lyase